MAIPAHAAKAISPARTLAQPSPPCSLAPLTVPISGMRDIIDVALHLGNWRGRLAHGDGGAILRGLQVGDGISGLSSARQVRPTSCCLCHALDLSVANGWKITAL